MSKENSNKFDENANDSKEIVDLSKGSEESKLEWVQLVNEMRGYAEQDENMPQRTVRKFKENPLIPLGCVVTTVCLTRGLYYMVRGDTAKQQLMMRGRVGAQAFTIGVFGLSAILIPLFFNKKS